jgi:MtN3 and saliva related transmembrane protein
MIWETSAIVGAFATVCSAVSFVPQAWKIVKSRDTRSISAPMYSITVVGFAAWLAYGLLRQIPPIIVTNAICMLLSSFILAMKLLPHTKKDEVADVLFGHSKPDNSPPPDSR